VRFRLALSITAALACAAFVQACSRPLKPQESCAFVQNPELQRVSWKDHLPLKLYLHNSVPVSAYDAIKRAVAEYNSRLGGGREIFRIEAYGVDGPMDPRRDGYSIVYWFSNWDPSRPTEQARTTIYWTGAEIFEADIRINAANFSYYMGENANFPNIDLDSLLVHELGHALGLAHNVTHGSVMNITLDDGQVRRDLGDVDLTNLKCEY
jgi:hypothetical protein